MNIRDLLNNEQIDANRLQPRKRQKLARDVEPRPPTLRHEAYTVAWICALYIEMATALAMLDETHASLPTSSGDSNHIPSEESHNIMWCLLVSNKHGTNNAANVVTNLRRTFPSIRVGLMVGIGGGVPSRANIRLGDIIVGTRVMQCDLGKIVGIGNLQRRVSFRLPDPLLRTAVSSLRAKHELQRSRVPFIMQQMLGRHPDYARPDLPDLLFEAAYDHASRPAPVTVATWQDDRIPPLKMKSTFTTYSSASPQQSIVPFFHANEACKQ
ncbi:hypothetical protein BDW72DRAFT_12515 [Aspergillus terricola var. indicus]